MPVYTYTTLISVSAPNQKEAEDKLFAALEQSPDLLSFDVEGDPDKEDDD